VLGRLAQQYPQLVMLGLDVLHEESGHRHAGVPRRDAVEPTLAGALDVARADGVLDDFVRGPSSGTSRGRWNSVVFLLPGTTLHYKMSRGCCGEPASPTSISRRSRSSRGTCPPGGSFRSVSTTESSTETGSPWASKGTRVLYHTASRSSRYHAAATSSKSAGHGLTRWSSPPTWTTRAAPRARRPPDNDCGDETAV